jgi:hypothetical protein
MLFLFFLEEQSLSRCSITLLRVLLLISALHKCRLTSMYRKGIKMLEAFLTTKILPHRVDSQVVTLVHRV